MQIVRVQRALPRLFRGSSSPFSVHSVLNRKFLKDETEEFLVFPYEREGDVTIVNWTMAEDGVINKELAFRNYELPKLLKRLGVKDASKRTVEVPNLKVQAAAPGKILEAGDNLDHEQFADDLLQVRNYLSDGEDLFVDDLGLFPTENHRLGVRLITRRPEMSLAVRTLLFKTPERPVQLHRGRKGWNFSVRYADDLDLRMKWDGQQYVDIDSTKPQPGHRPILVFFGPTKAVGADDVALQFVEFRGEIVGATLIAPETVSLSTLTQAIGTAGSVILNNNPEQAAYATLPCATLVKGGRSTVVLQPTDEVLAQAVAAGATVHSAHFSTLSTRGIGPVLSGAVTQKSLPAGAADSTYAYALNLAGAAGHAVDLSPDNLTFPASQIVVLDPQGKTTTAEQIKALMVQLADTNKEVVLGEILAQAKLVKSVKQASEIAALL